jgi:hypothetical protein
VSYVTVDLVSDDGERRKSRRNRRRSISGALFLGALGALVLSSPPAANPIDGLAINPTTIAFAPQSAGVQVVKMVSINNEGTTTFEATKVAIVGDSAAFVLTTEDCGTILPHGQCHAGVGFAPPRAGPYEAVLTIQEKGGNERDIVLTGVGTARTKRGPIPPTNTTASVSGTDGSTGTSTSELSGNGTTTSGSQTGSGGSAPTFPKFVLSPNVFQFGDRRLGTSQSQRFTITNAGSGSGLVHVALENDDQFRLDTVCGSAKTPPEGSCEGTITFTPSMRGSVTTQLIVSDDRGTTQPVTLSGRGILHQLRPLANVVKFAANGPDSKAIAFINQGDDAFVVSDAVADAPYSSGPDGCAGAVPPNKTCRVVVFCRDAGRASKGRRLVLTGPQDPVTVELMPEAASAPLRAFVRLAPLSSAFNTGEYTQQFLHVFNDGKADLNISEILFQPPTAALHLASKCNGPVPPGGECQVMIVRRGQYDPKTVLVVISDASNSPTVLALPAKLDLKPLIMKRSEIHLR